MCAWYGWQRVGSEMETAFYSSFTEHTHTLYVRHVRGEKYGILQVCVRSGAKQRGGYRLRLIFVWSVSWAVFGFWIFKVHFFFFFWQIYLLVSVQWMFVTLVSVECGHLPWG